MRTAERGFTLIEVLIASAIVILTAFSGLAVCKAIARVTALGYTAAHSAATIQTQAGQLRDDAATAFAVFIPLKDINGAANGNGDGSGAHEIDYYTKGDGGKTGAGDQEYFWCYLYDRQHQTLQRFDYDAAHSRGVRDVSTGQLNVAAAYPLLEGITEFSVRPIPADKVGDPGLNRYSGLAQLLGGAPPHAHAIRYDNPGSSAQAVTGGNGIIEVRLVSAAAARVVHLAAGTMASGFTVTGLPRWHAILYRVDQTHRFDFGFAGKSHVFINALIELTYDDWKSKPTTWCNMPVLGPLDPHDPHADYKPNEPFEQAEALLRRCRQTYPTPPPEGFPGNPPDPGVVAQQIPLPTPPPCWTNPGPQGRCWPPDAPVDWSPPSPMPVDTPPPAWCATRAESSACKRALREPL